MLATRGLLLKKFQERTGIDREALYHKLDGKENE
jgi:hypothetical protein